MDLMMPFSEHSSLLLALMLQAQCNYVTVEAVPGAAAVVPRRRQPVKRTFAPRCELPSLLCTRSGFVFYHELHFR
jgi:hypothetical protein